MEVRNAAEEAARIAREQEQARIDEANAQNEEQPQVEPAVNEGGALPAVTDAAANVEAPQ